MLIIKNISSINIECILNLRNYEFKIRDSFLEQRPFEEVFFLTMYSIFAIGGMDISFFSNKTITLFWEE